MIEEIKKLYDFFGLNEIDERSSKELCMDYDTLDDFHDKIMKVLNTKEFSFVLDGKPFKILTLFNMYECYSQTGMLAYYPSMWVRKQYDEMGTDKGSMIRRMRELQKEYEIRG